MAKPYDPKDFYYRKAKKAGLRARSAFKIEEILRRHRLVRHGDAVLDLGAAPGGFLQILAEAVGEKGVAVGVDLEPIRNLGKPWVRTATVDLLAPGALEKIRALHPGRFRLVTSDMAPKTIGIKVTDEARSLELVRMAFAVAEQTLSPGGAFVAKLFMGGDFPALRKELQAQFETFHVIRPEATRESSYEVYVLGKGFRRAQAAHPERNVRDAAAESKGTAQAAPPERSVRDAAAESKGTAQAAPPERSVRGAAAAESKGTSKTRTARKATAKSSPPGKKPAPPRRPAPRRHPHPKSAPPSRARR